MGRLAPSSAAPEQFSCSAIKKVVRYLKGTKGRGITFKPGNGPYIESYLGSGLAGNQVDRKPTTGIVFIASGKKISWRSKKQTVVAFSTCEAEYVAFSKKSLERVWAWKWTAQWK